MKNLYIRRFENDEIVRTIPVRNESQVEKTMSGILRNMDMDRFYIDDSEFCESENDKGKDDA